MIDGAVLVIGASSNSENRPLMSRHRPAGKSPSLASWRMTVSASEAGAAGPGGAWPWAALLALTCLGVYLALRPPLLPPIVRVC